MDQQTQTEKQQTASAKRPRHLLVKAVVVGMLAGFVGGAASFGALTLYDNMNVSNQNASVSVTDKSAKLSKASANNSGAMTAAYQKVSGAVVSVVNLQRQSNSTTNAWSSLIGGNSTSKKQDSKLETYSEGSGVVYLKSATKAYIVTNNHVVSGSDAVQAIMANGKKVTAKIVGTDATTDLAVLSIPAKDVNQVAEFGDSKSLVAGQTVIAVGSPLGTAYASSVTQGIISAPNRVLTTSTSQQTVVQTDAAINPGNSGGALVNSAGQVIGINSMKLAESTDGTSVEGMGFAIPANEVVDIINQLVKKGKITRPQLGIRVIALGDIPTTYRHRLGIETQLKSGIYVAEVTKNSGAAKDGMKAKDVITAVDGKKVTTVLKLHEFLNQHKVGNTVTITVSRDGKLLKLPVKLESN